MNAQPQPATTDHRPLAPVIPLPVLPACTPHQRLAQIHRQRRWSVITMILSAIPGVSLIVASSISVDLGVWGPIAGLIAALTGLWVAVRKVTPERRKLQAEADRLTQEADEIEARLRRDVVSDLREEMQRLRQEAVTARAEADTARAEMSIKIAEWKEERHTMVNELAVRALRITHLEHKVDALDEEVRSLRIALNMETGRRRSDGPSPPRPSSTDR